MSKIEMGLSPPWVPARECALKPRDRNEMHVKPVREDGDRHECPDVGSAVGQFCPRRPIRHQGDRSWRGIEFAMERDRALRERTKPTLIALRPVPTDSPVSINDS